MRMKSTVCRKRILAALVAALAVIAASCSAPPEQPAVPSSGPPQVEASPAQTVAADAADARPILVTFTKPGCPACAKLAPGLADLKKRYEEKVRFEEINIAKAQKLVFDYEISLTPTVILYVGGKEAKRLLNPQAPAIQAALDAALVPGPPAGAAK